MAIHTDTPLIACTARVTRLFELAFAVTTPTFIRECELLPVTECAQSPHLVVTSSTRSPREPATLGRNYLDLLKAERAAVFHVSFGRCGHR